MQDLLDRRLDIRQRTGCRPSSHDELKDVRIGHVMDTTEIGHDDRHGTAHSRAATDKHPIVLMVARDPFNRVFERGRVCFAEFFEWNPLVDDTGGRLRGEFFGNEQHGADMSRRLLGLVDISHKEGIRNLIHETSIREDRREVKQKRTRPSVAVTFFKTLYSLGEES